jgi:ribosomal protein L34
VTLPHTQPQRRVSGFQIRGGSYSGRGMLMARLLISAAWVFLVAAFAAYVVIAWLG